MGLADLFLWFTLISFISRYPLSNGGDRAKILLMLECFDDDFLKMLEGFAVIVIFAMLTFYLLNYMSQNEELSAIVLSMFESISK